MVKSGANRRKKTKPTSAEPFAAVAERVAAIRRLAPSSIDEDALRTLVGTVRLRTLHDIRDVFGAARNTIQTSWRQDGCPGTPGAYDVAAVLAWLLARDARRSRGQRAVNGYAHSNDSSSKFSKLR